VLSLLSNVNRKMEAPIPVRLTARVI